LHVRRRQGQRRAYALDAQQGVTYAIDTDLLTLQDTIVMVYGCSSQPPAIGDQFLAQNDDDDRPGHGGSVDSYLEWRCPQTCPPGQSYYIVVEDGYETTGRFTIRVTIIANAGSGSGR
jgi:hypothetical protein